MTEVIETPEAVETPKAKVNVLITGGAGFLGSHVAKHCMDLGFHVVILDNLSGGFTDNVPEGCSFFRASITDNLERLFSTFKFKYVYHLAADARENLSHFTAQHCYHNNLIGTVNVVNACVNHGVECIVFTSSIAVMAGAEPPYEEGDPIMPADPYGIAKAACEQHLWRTLDMFGLNHIIFRPFNIYGPNQNIGDKYRNVVGIFMNQIMQGEPMTIFGDGEQRRNFSYVDDVAPHIAASVTRPDLYNNVFFIGGGVSHTVNELAYVVANEFGIQPEIKYLQARHEARIAQPTIQKAMTAFGAPKVPLQQGVKLMANWAREVGPRKSQNFLNIEIKKNMPEGW